MYRYDIDIYLNLPFIYNVFSLCYSLSNLMFNNLMSSPIGVAARPGRDAPTAPPGAPVHQHEPGVGAPPVGHPAPRAGRADEGPEPEQLHRA